MEWLYRIIQSLVNWMLIHQEKDMMRIEDVRWSAEDGLRLVRVVDDQIYCHSFPKKQKLFHICMQLASLYLLFVAGQNCTLFRTRRFWWGFSAEQQNKAQWLIYQIHYKMWNFIVPDIGLIHITLLQRNTVTFGEEVLWNIHLIVSVPSALVYAVWEKAWIWIMNFLPSLIIFQHCLNQFKCGIVVFTMLISLPCSKILLLEGISIHRH